MQTTLPPLFAVQMKNLLGDEFVAFMASYEEERWYGLRVNGLKIQANAFLALAPIGDQLVPIPWSRDGYYYPENERPGKHPFYHAGLYYIQEPSAMAPVELLDVQPGHRVLDLCAAPGGKSTQIAACLQGQGLLVANDNAGERAKTLAKNIERAGVRNAIVLQEEPGSLVKAFPRYFDRILVDAPCSGEGMFRKEPAMMAYWGKHAAARYAAMQDEILRQAAAMLAPGGRLVYSTCTFTPEENEDRVASLLHDHPELAVLPIEADHGWQPGYAKTVSSRPDARLEGTIRLWPHHLRGEGHYAAVLVNTLTEASAQPLRGNEASAPRGEVLRTGQQASRRARRGESLAVAASDPRRGRPGRRTEERRGRKEEARPDAESLWTAFAGEHLLLEQPLAGKLIAYGARLYLQPEGLPALDGLRVVRAGWYLGEAGKHRFEPSQALAMGLHREEAARVVNLGAADEAVWRYLRGETLEIAEQDIQTPASDQPAGVRKGYTLVCVEGYPIGWGKWQAGVLKNELSPGWRVI
ncbi:RsmB/NOP family class I SAM-dependent RNA methyltransferase [Paenibacillus daejeonensis]|uniref:RsmB/NOP family class I SAM-dependent RNA methyltransferase n=1 Tax=Paenibacillus daejeonensis TaxID=135193 RepID=UPI00035C108C|nr:RsmF rRNA methyltransferase first C-terminal domain-containing protein [Paenibacillus daejeonensis]